MSALLLSLILSQSTPSPLAAGYEGRLVEWALHRHQREIDVAPEGKIIDEVLIASENVLAASDPYPLWLNAIHVQTQEGVIRREVLVSPGETWTTARISETERNLRQLYFIGVSRVVAVRAPNDHVAVLVVTKDRWSLRLSNSFTSIGPLLQSLQLQLTEINFWGRGQQLAASTLVRLDTISLGQSFSERRLFGSRLSFGETASIILNRQTGVPEGSMGSVSFGRPIQTLDQPWAYQLDGNWNVRRRRLFRGASIWRLPYPDEGSLETIPNVYDVREFLGQASVTRRLGSSTKFDTSLAAGGYSRQYIAPKRTGLSEAQRTWLTANYLPRSEDVTYVSAYARAFPVNYRVLRNIDTIDLSEDYHLGWLAQGGIRWALPLPFTPSHFVEVGAALRYRAYEFDDLFGISVAAATRIRPGQRMANQHLAAEIVNYSPRFEGGRLVTRVLVDFKWNDLDNRRVLLGGSTGLRGTLPEEFSGRHYILANIEYRARAFEILTNSISPVLFYDAGAAFDVTPSFTHTVGLGFRILLPQLNRDVLRIDLGWVVGGTQPGLDRLNAAWGQITDLRPTFLDDPL